MNVLIVATNRNELPIAVMPFGACIVAEAASDAGHNVHLLDLMFERNPVRALERTLKSFSPDVVGLSVRNIDNNDMNHPQTFFDELSPLVRIIRLRTKAVLVIGGAALGIMPEEFLRFTNADFVVPAQGRKVFPTFLSALLLGDNPRKVPGVAWLEKGIFFQNSFPSDDEPEECSAPDFTRWLDTAAYFTRFSSAPLQSKKGCPFRCVYCTYSLGEGSEYVLAPPEHVVGAVRAMVSRGIKDIEFVDNVFNAPYEHAIEVCKSLSQARTGARFQTVELNPQFVDDHLLSEMEKAGFCGVGITAESVSDPALKGLGKGFTRKEVEKTAAAVARHDIPALWMFMLGGPGETKETVQETLQFAADQIRPRDAAFFNVGIRIYPGTLLESIARTEGVLTVPQSEMFNPVNYVSPRVSAAWITERVRRAMEGHYNFMNSNSLSLRFLPMLFRAAHMIGVRPPLWKNISALRKGFRLLGVPV